MKARRGNMSGDPAVTDLCLASKHKTLNQCWLNASPALQSYVDIVEKDSTVSSILIQITHFKTCN